MLRILRSLTLAFMVVAFVGASLTLAGNRKIEKDYDPVIDPDDFEDGNGDPYAIDNPYWPLVPGTTFRYEAETEDGLEVNTVYVTHLTREILGVTCTVVLDRVWEDGLLTEETNDWYAQNADGEIWYFGEDSTAYEYDDDGNLIGTSDEGSWEAGVDDAKPGIVMLASPAAGDRYRQEYYEDEAEDMALVMRTNASVDIDYGTWKKFVLQTKEWSALEPGAVEQKFYVPDVGLVLVKELKGKTTFVELVAIETE